ncbi:hypothetical protein BSKO_07809 [Bryopsis sp. KO-2023]|nr:hypothetical protein BSKO_07809 [Bryopsis sp. KO-2023]
MSAPKFYRSIFLAAAIELLRLVSASEKVNCECRARGSRGKMGVLVQVRPPSLQYHLSSVKICWDGDGENPAVNRDNETPPGLLSDLKDTSVGQQQKPWRPRGNSTRRSKMRGIVGKDDDVAVLAAVIGIPEHQDPCHGGDTGLLGGVARLLQELIRHLSVSVWRGGAQTGDCLFPL